jgi:hypothetical protein
MTRVFWPGQSSLMPARFLTRTRCILRTASGRARASADTSIWRFVVAVGFISRIAAKRPAARRRVAIPSSRNSLAGSRNTISKNGFRASGIGIIDAYSSTPPTEAAYPQGHSTGAPPPSAPLSARAWRRGRNRRELDFATLEKSVQNPALDFSDPDRHAAVPATWHLFPARAPGSRLAAWRWSNLVFQPPRSGRAIPDVRR